MWSWLIRNKEWVFSGIGIVVLVALWHVVTRFIAGAWRWLQRPMGPSSKPVHRVELKIVPDHVVCQWQEGSATGKEAMLVYCKLYLTNVAPIRPFQILDVCIKKPFTRGYIQPRGRGSEIPMIPELGNARLAGQFEARFTISPPVCESGSVFTCDVVLVDQFGEEHTAKGVQFQPMGGPAWANMRREERSKKLEEVAERAVERTKNQA